MYQGTNLFKDQPLETKIQILNNSFQNIYSLRVSVHPLGTILDRLAKNGCYERDRTSIWLYFDMSEITVEEEYRGALTALHMNTCTGPGKRMVPRLREFFRQGQAEVLSNSKKKFSQPGNRFFVRALY